MQSSLGTPVGLCAVTGANGFVGSRVVRSLLRRGHRVVALVGADLDDVNLDGLDVECRPFDLLDPGSVRRALAGCDTVIHSAACYAFWSADPRQIYRVNVEGTRHVLAAARDFGIRKLVYTSSVATLSPGFRLEDDPEAVDDEDAILDMRRFLGPYKTSKAMAEMLVLREAARGLPAVIVHPTSVLGPGDRRPTPTGSMIVHFLNGRMKVYVGLVHNVVDVRDVAAGHVLALERGRAGERYVLGGENLLMSEIVRILAELTGLAPPWFTVPRPVLEWAGRVNEWVSDHVTHRPPLVPREAALHARDSRAFDISKARKELGFEARPARAVLADAVRWFAGAGFCPAGTAKTVLERLGDPPDLDAPHPRARAAGDASA
jgi:dihydroflavonol-4-reductase